MKRKSWFHEKTSQALIIAIFVLTLVFVVGTGILFRGRSQQGSISLQYKKDNAYSLAKSGIDMAEAQIKSQGCGATGNLTEATYTMGAGDVTIKAASGVITSIGHTGETYQVLTKTVQVPKSQPGEVGWAKFYKTRNSNNETQHFSPVRMRPTSNGGHIMAGGYNYNGDGGLNTNVVIKLNASGEQVWAKEIHFTGANNEFLLKDIAQTSDGGYALATTWEHENAGQGKTGALVIKMDNNGNLISKWIYTPTSTYNNITPIRIQEVPSGGYILGGELFDLAGNKYYLFLMRILADGSISWVNKYYTPVGLTVDHGDELWTLDNIVNGGGGFIAAGMKRISDNNSDVLLFKTDNSGNIGAAYPGTWTKFYHMTSSYTYGNSLRATSIQEISDGYIIGGTVSKIDDIYRDSYILDDRGILYAFESSGDDFRDSCFLAIRTDSSGNIGTGVVNSWAKIYFDRNHPPSSPSGEQHGLALYSINQDTDGYVLAGETAKFNVDDDDMLLIKTNASGGVNWAKTYDNTAPDSHADFAWGAYPSGNGYVINGWSMLAVPRSGSGLGFGSFPIKTDASGNVPQTVGPCGGEGACPITRDVTSDVNAVDCTNNVIVWPADNSGSDDNKKFLYTIETAKFEKNNSTILTKLNTNFVIQDFSPDVTNLCPAP